MQLELNCIASNSEVIILSPEMRQNYRINYEKFGFKTQLMYLRAWLWPDSMEELTKTHRICIPETVMKMLHGRIMPTWVKLTDLQILGYELHCTKMRLAAWLRRDPLGELWCSPDLLSIIIRGGKENGWEWE